jgi:tyrosyl-tRNA synthetase
MSLNIAETLEVIKRGTVELISEGELVKKLEKGKPLRIKAGFDPTSPDLHLGHTVLMQKLKQFQELGHQVIFLIGDFTATIGDPSGRNETRPALSEKEIKTNVKTYEDQVFKILDRKKTQVVFNSAWMEKLSSSEIIRIASKMTVARMLERNDFEKRYKREDPIAIHEFLYPLMQGYDSVQLHADVELGGTDQKFNLLVGRELQRDYGQEPQVILTLPLLVGTDGVQKMSKSYGNFIGIAEPAKGIFGKIMSLSDETMWSYYELLSDLSIGEIAALKEEVKAGRRHPKEVKITLGSEIAARFHGKEAAKEAALEFENIFKKGGVPDEIEEVNLPKSSESLSLVELLSDLKLAESKSEAKRLIQQNAVTVNDQKISNIDAKLRAEGSYLVKVGKRRFKKINFS